MDSRNRSRTRIFFRRRTHAQRKLACAASRLFDGGAPGPGSSRNRTYAKSARGTKTSGRNDCGRGRKEARQHAADTLSPCKCGEAASAAAVSRSLRSELRLNPAPVFVRYLFPSSSMRVRVDSKQRTLCRIAAWTVRRSAGVAGYGMTCSCHDALSPSELARRTELRVCERAAGVRRGEATWARTTHRASACGGR
jgi:hypothetical protein